MGVRKKTPAIQCITLWFDAFSIAALSLAITASTSLFAETPAPETYGLTLPLPSEPFALPRTDGTFIGLDRYVPFTLTINDKGRITSYSAEIPADSIYLSASDSLLRTIRFAAGSFNGQKGSFRLPVVAYVRSQASHLRMIFPIDHDHRIKDMPLYLHALRLNDIFPPSIKTFPPYFYQPSADDSSMVYAFLLAELKLDEDGQPDTVKKILSSAGTYTDQILSAIHWGEYRPLKVRGEPMEATCFVLVSLFSEVNYPSKERAIASRDADTSTAQERWRVRMFADTIGEYLAPPVPRRYQALTYTAVDSVAVTFGKVSVRVRIDKNGRLHIGRISRNSPALKAIVEDISRRQRFYPAIDYHGVPLDFTGTVYLDFFTSGIVRILPAWL